jgi:UDP:flavonoid glycosyltransferase YjiC (YdhE family)
MKVLVVCVPGSGHINPLLPVVESFLAGGDQVMVASGTNVAGAVERVGADFYPAGHGENAWFEQLQARVRGFPGDGLAPERIIHYFLPRLFGEVAAPDMIDDVLAAGRELDTDVVLFETYALAGPLCADVLGVAGVHHLLGPILPHDVLELANDAVSPLWRSFGRDAPGYAGVYGGLTIEICPPSLESRRVPAGERLVLRPAPVPDPASRTSSRPLVYVTLGTFFGANIGIFRDVLAALADEPVEVVVTVGADQAPTALDPVPDNARVERFIPQARLLPRCAAVVHHGGSGTTLGSLAHGRPQVAVPQGADNFINAAMLERAGVGLVLLPGEVTPAAVRDAVRRVLWEPSFATAAQRAAAEIAGMPGPDEVVEKLRARYTDAGARDRGSR